jgi:hypothetical protein
MLTAIINTMLVVQLQAPIDSGWEVNTDGPWNLVISSLEGGSLEKAEINLKMPGYVLTFHQKKAVSFKYKIDAYYCVHDKSQCQKKTFAGNF